MKLAKAAFLLALTGPVIAQVLPNQPLPAQIGETISPARPVPTGQAPHMLSKLIKNTPEEKVYSIIFYKDDEVLSGLTDFAISNHITDAHFTAIGAARGATLAWLDLDRKVYEAIPVTLQVEILALTGDVAVLNGRPSVHMHTILGRSDGSTVGGHVFALHADPTVEVFLTADATPLNKRSDAPSGMKLIDPTE